MATAACTAKMVAVCPGPLCVLLPVVGPTVYPPSLFVSQVTGCRFFWEGSESFHRSPQDNLPGSRTPGYSCPAQNDPAVLCLSLPHWHCHMSCNFVHASSWEAIQPPHGRGYEGPWQQGHSLVA